MKRTHKTSLGIFVCVSLLLLAAPFVFFLSEKQAAPPQKTASSPAAPSISSPAAAPGTSSPSLASSPTSKPLSKIIWSAPSDVTGEALHLSAAAHVHADEEHATVGRSGLLDMRQVTSPATLREGDVLTIPLFDGEDVEGRVQLVRSEAGGVVRVGGKLTGNEAGTFSLTQLPTGVEGRILVTDRKTAYLIQKGVNGTTTVVEKPLSEVLCTPYPQANTLSPSGSTDTAARVAVPILSSRPTAPAVIYLDFDGETVADPDWNGGATIQARPYALTEAQITAAWNRVKEDYLPFNIDVTTNVNRYNSTAPGRRMRCIITPNDVASPGAGGVAYVDSFSGGGTSFSSTIPCWVFNDTPSTIAAGVAHEVGHTLGLEHDGTTSPRDGYYDGHGTGLVSWGPIMGSGYYSTLTQWSKGEYNYANNRQDDLAIISSSRNFFGYAIDDFGDVPTTAAVLARSNTNVNQLGVISRTGDIDCFAFTTGAGTVSITTSPAAHAPNLDIKLDLLNGDGALIASYNPSTDTMASFTRSVSAGTYFLQVSGTGRGNVLTDGYSNYGSLGAYTVSGSIPAVAQPPTIISSTTALCVSGQPFSYQIIATNNPTSYSVVGVLPAGLSLNSASGLLSGIPSRLGVFPIEVRATNPYGTGSKSVSITISSTPVPVVVSSPAANALVGSPFQYQISASNWPTSYAVTGELPTGLALNATTGLISGIPVVAGPNSFTVSASNDGGTGTKDVSVSIQATVASIANAVDSNTTPWSTGGAAPWRVVTTGAFDGADAARSGAIPHRRQSWMQTTVTGPVRISFRWRVSCEPRNDNFRFKVNGVVKSSITGATPWQAKTFDIPSGTHTLQWVYQKNASISRGADAGFVDRVIIPAAAFK